jgi:hypothetical protein
VLLLLTDPTVAQVGDGHPLDSHSGLGLSAFCYSLVLVVRSILYYDAQGDAGLPRGRVILGLGLAVACLSGFDVTRFYDRKGPHRNPADKEPQPVLARTQADDP